jgi:hypothetical protein
MGPDGLPFTARVGRMDGRVFQETTYGGIIRLKEDALVLEYRAEVTEVGGGSMETRRGAIAEHAIPVDAIRSVTCSRGLLRRPVLDIELARLGPADGIPWAAGARVRLQLPRGGQGSGRELCTDVRLLKADARLRELGQGDLTG